MLNSSLQITPSPLHLSRVNQAQPWGYAQPDPLQMGNMLHVGTQSHRSCEEDLHPVIDWSHRPQSQSRQFGTKQLNASGVVGWGRGWRLGGILPANDLLKLVSWVSGGMQRKALFRAIRAWESLCLCLPTYNTGRLTGHGMVLQIPCRASWWAFKIRRNMKNQQSLANEC